MTRQRQNICEYMRNTSWKLISSEQKEKPKKPKWLSRKHQNENWKLTVIFSKINFDFVFSPSNSFLKLLSLSTLKKLPETDFHTTVLQILHLFSSSWWNYLVDEWLAEVELKTRICCPLAPFLPCLLCCISPPSSGWWISSELSLPHSITYSPPWFTSWILMRAFLPSWMSLTFFPNSQFFCHCWRDHVISRRGKVCNSREISCSHWSHKARLRKIYKM